MTLTLLHRAAHTLLKEIEMDWRKSNLRNFWSSMQESFNPVLDLLHGNKANPQHLTSAYDNFAQRVQKVTRESNVLQIGLELKEFQDQTNARFEQIENEYLRRCLSLLKGNYNTLWNVLEEYMKQGYRVSDAKKVFDTLSSIPNQIKEIRRHEQSLQVALKATDSKIELADGTDRLYLSFPDSELSLQNIREHLEFLTEIYSQIKKLIVDQSAFQDLQLLRIESGSEGFSLLGSKHVLDFMKWLLTSAANFFHSNFTRDGKIAKLSPTIEVLSNEIDIIKKLNELNKEMGSESTVEQQLRDSASEVANSIAIIAKRTTKLLNGQPRVVVDETVVALSDAHTDKFIEYSKKQLPGDVEA